MFILHKAMTSKKAFFALHPGMSSITKWPKKCVSYSYRHSIHSVYTLYYVDGQAWLTNKNKVFFQGVTAHPMKCLFSKTKTSMYFVAYLTIIGLSSLSDVLEHEAINAKADQKTWIKGMWFISENHKFY